jgi:TRAP-type mannitol/chloroaromatic compound transport system substrate-binding protein
MKRKMIVGVLVLLMTVLLMTPAMAQDKVIKWKVQGFVPAGMIFHDTLVRTAEIVKEVTKGRLVWDVYAAGVLVPPFEALKAVSDGVFDASYDYTGMWVGKIPAAPLFTAAPGGMNVLDIQMWLEHGGGKELHQEMYDKYGYKVKVLLTAPISAEIFLWAKKPLRKIQDFKGLKLRMMPLMGDVLSKNGLSSVYMPAGEIIPNLQRGVIDAAEYSIPSFDKTLGIWEICKYLHVPGIHQPASQIEVVVNKKSYDALPADLKVQLDAAMWQSRLQNWLWMEIKNLEAMDFFKAKGITVVEMDPATVKTFIKWADIYMDDMSAKDEFFAKVRKSQKAFTAKWYPYAKGFTLPH